MAPDYAVFLDPAGLQGARIGVARDFFGFHSGVDALMEEAIDAMRAAGAVIIDPVRFPNREQLGTAEYSVLLYDFKADMAQYLSGLGPDAPARSLADLIAFIEANREREMSFFGQEIFIEAESKGPLTDTAYREALATCRRLSRAEGIDAAIGRNRLDAIIAPTGGPAWTTDLINGDHYSGGSSTLAAVSGYPNITVPAGHIQGLPVGLSLFGAAWTEGRLIRIAHAFEQATNHRRTPAFLSSIDASAGSSIG
jgi:amidase